MLISRVKTFNVRSNLRLPTIDDEQDFRQTQEFKALDEIVSGFLNTFPSHLRTPVRNGAVDGHLYAAMIAADTYVAFILSS